MRFGVLFAAAMVVAGSVVARADTYQFTFSGSAADSFNFQLTTPFVPTTSSTDPPNPEFTISGVPITLDGVSTTAELLFEDGAGASFGIVTSSPSEALAYFAHSDLFVAPASDPTFLPDSYSLLELATEDGATNQSGTLVITDLTPPPPPPPPPPPAVTPEPASLALMGTGLLGVLGVARRRSVR